ncbi:hypothetical protein [Eubacterium callanderi]|uniref:hypothetical protein n=1 Tax=Eubacterium callanderi TaxID=53442 RepID=UPI0011DD019F|nr:hypothetical protein [Eubacterium callanderi]WPK75667.1 hypothetical protein EUCAG14_12080 [Eubacterium callanderi]
MPVQIDMEMPRSCLDCRFCTNYRQMDCARCHAVGDYGGREIPECSTSELYAGRQDWCPLVETEDRTWHVVAEGDLPPKLKDGKRAKTYLITKQNGRNDTRKSIDFAFWNGEAFGRERKCNIGVSGVLAWRELPDPWEGVMK